MGKDRGRRGELSVLRLWCQLSACLNLELSEWTSLQWDLSLVVWNPGMVEEEPGAAGAGLEGLVWAESCVHCSVCGGVSDRKGWVVVLPE